MQKSQLEKSEKKILELQNETKENADRIEQISHEMQEISTSQRSNQKIKHDIDLKINSNSAN